jgi:hypothetical protein
MKGFCDTCGRYMLYPDTHHCPPQWQIWKDDNGDASGPEDAKYSTTAYGHDEGGAAETAAEYFDGRYGEGPHSHVVFVRKAGTTDTAKRFDVTFEYSVDYSAKEKP